MKKLILLSAILLTSLISYKADAQVSVNVNIGTQPVWGPVGYDYVQYYYLPDIDAYYAVDARRYTYFSGGRWITSAYLPPMYRNYDLYHGYKVVVNEQRPWLNNDRYRRDYGKYKGRHDQPFIRDSRDSRYFANPRHPQHAKWNGNAHPGNPMNRPQQVMPPRGDQQQHGGQGNGNNDHRDNNGHSGDRGNDKGGDRGGDNGHGHGNEKGDHGHR